MKETEGDLVTVLATGNPATIAVAKSILEAEGIEYFAKNEGVQDLFAGGRIGTGFNPLVGPVEIQVVESEVEHAKAVLADLVKGEIDHSESSDMNDGDEEEMNYYESDGKPSKLFKGILIGIVISGVILFLYNRHEKSFSGVTEYDFNRDSKPDTFYTYENGKIVEVSMDRNYDGHPDSWFYYSNSVITKSEFDDNFDGRIETNSLYKNGILSEVKIDQDLDSFPDIVEYYKFGVLKEKEWYYQSTNMPYKKEVFSQGIKKEEFIDNDKDGRFDIKITYDSLEHPVSTTRLK
jgi:hypothetical protein